MHVRVHVLIILLISGFVGLSFKTDIQGDKVSTNQSFNEFIYHKKEYILKQTHCFIIRNQCKLLLSHYTFDSCICIKEFLSKDKCIKHIRSPPPPDI